MDSEVTGRAPARPLRRSTRQSLSANAKALNFEPTPRGPLKRTKQPSKPQSAVPASNGTNNNDSEDDSDDGSPNKKSRLPTRDVQSGGDCNAPPEGVLEMMETQNESEGLGRDEEAPLKHSHFPLNPTVPGVCGDFKLTPLVVLGQRCSLPETQNVIKPQVQQPKKSTVSSSKCVTSSTPPKGTSEACQVTVTSMTEYKRKMEAKITENPKGNHYVPSNYTISTSTTRQRPAVPIPKASVPEKKQEKKKAAVSPQRAGVPSKGFLHYFCQLVLLMFLSAGALLAFKHLHTLQRTKVGTAPSKSVNSGVFVEELSRLASRFPSQRPELWRRSKIHLQKHLDTPHPTEPVSLVLTAGLKAKKTLHCLAQSIASAFSSALNASVVDIDGESKANLDSDQVKMDIDNQLNAAFEGDKLAAVVHRFEELPPGSTLIFYRYCDHETAAYKQAFLLFTVLLSVDDLSTQQSLKEVEEMVRDQVEERFVGNETAFNKMDADKFSGLWSRIAHLILPVALEAEVEQRGC